MNLKTDLVVLEVVVHISTLPPMQFSYELLNISIKHRLYLIPQLCLFGSAHFHEAFRVLPSGGIVVEPYLSVLAADCPLSQHLGFNLMSSSIFFLLSQQSHLHLIFRYYVVVILALGVSSNSSSIG